LTFETLLVWLNEKIPTTAGVKYIFTLPEGNEIREVNQFVGGRSYVVSSVRKIIHVTYGETKERFWRNRCALYTARGRQVLAASNDHVITTSYLMTGLSPLIQQAEIHCRLGKGVRRSDAI